MSEQGYIFDCDTYCEQCLPVSASHAEVSLNDGEQDSPAHCCDCGRPVDYSLTSEGVRYVLERIRESIRRREHLSSATMEHEHCPSYYKGSPVFAIVRDWAEDLQWYGGLTVKEENLVRRYLDMTAPQSAWQES